MALALLLHLALTASAAMGQYSSTTTFSFTGNTLPTGLVKSYWDVAECDNDNAKYNRLFEEQNVQVRDGFMDLIVPGGQTTSPIRSAEVGTEFEVLYGSVRTYAILTDEPGVCNGMFMYFNASQETDIEWISDPESGANQDANNGTRAMLYTNQGPNGNEDATTVSGRAASDATSAVHEYRLDWEPDETRFYLDGELQQTITENVPSVGGQWLWNNWVNGDSFFTVGPPENDAIFRIQRIVMLYNPA